MSGDDVAGITWHTPDVEPLTQSEVDAEMVRLEALAATTEANRIAALQAARAFALSLGFTEAMLAVMYPQLKGA
jgi:S-methylmethionine-dependent homocysteine/selenocysteine methylase